MPRPPARRRTGMSSRSSRDGKDFFRSLVNDSEVQEAVRDHILAGKPGAIDFFFEAVAHLMGRPRGTVRLDVNPELLALLSTLDQAAGVLPGATAAPQ